MVRDEIIKCIERVCGEKVHLEVPVDVSFGDYSTNVAMILAKKGKTNPKELAEKIVKKLSKDKELYKRVSKVETAGPGFINFWLKREFLLENLGEIMKKGKKYGASNMLKNKKFLIEHTSPDPIKTIHIGHLRNNFLGMTMRNILTVLGARVVLDCVNNDRGTHVMRAIWGYLAFGRKEQKLMDEVEYELRIKEYGFGDDEVKRVASGKKWREVIEEWAKGRDGWYQPEDLNIGSDKFNNAFYSLGQRSCDLVSGVNEQVQEMLRAWEEEEENLRNVWKQVIDWSLAGYAKTYRRIGSHHDKVWHESEIYRDGKKWITRGLKKGVFRKLDDGAVLTDLSSYGLPDTIIQKRDGTAVYHTQDLQLTYLKVKTFPSDLYIWDIGSEQKLYLRQLFAMCEQLGIVKEEKLKHLSYGFLTLRGGEKMSSRYGGVVNGDDLLDELHTRAREIIETSDPKLRGEMSEEEKEELAERVAISACKYGFMKYGREKDVAFDIDESLSLSGNSGPYLQYTFARTQSVLNKAKGKEIKEGVRGARLNDEEMLVLRQLSRFPEIICDAAKNYSPNTLCNYLYELAQKYNSFYNSNRIIGGKREEFGLALTYGVGQVLENGLHMLGIEAPERM